jgi:hypothetical protein
MHKLQYYNFAVLINLYNNMLRLNIHTENHTNILGFLTFLIYFNNIIKKLAAQQGRNNPLISHTKYVTYFITSE